MRRVRGPAVEAVFVLAEAWAEGTIGPTPCDPHLWAKRSDPDDPCHHVGAILRVLVSPILAGVLMEPARVDAMFRNTPRGLCRSQPHVRRFDPSVLRCWRRAWGALHPEPVPMPMRMDRTLSDRVERWRCWTPWAADQVWPIARAMRH